MRRPLIALAAAAALAAGTAYSPGAVAAPAVDPLALGFQGEGGLEKGAFDGRTGVVAPSAAQRAAVSALGGRAVWNAFGSPKVLTRDDRGYLAGPRAGAPADVARAFVRDNAVVFGLTADQVTPAALKVVKDVPLAEGPALRAKNGGARLDRTGLPSVVTFQQVYTGAPNGIDGRLTVGMDPKGRVAIATSTVSAVTKTTNSVRLSPVDALVAAAKDAGVAVTRSQLKLTGAVGNTGARLVRRVGFADQQSARLVTVPTPRDGVRLAWESVLLQAVASGPDALTDRPFAYVSTVDAQTGKVLFRSNRLQYADGEAKAPGTASVPYYNVFPNYPGQPVQGVQQVDNREYWCFTAGPDCALTIASGEGKASTVAYDENIDEATGQAVPTFATDGNNARTAVSRVSQLTPDTVIPALSPTRQYDFPFTDQWQTSGCDPQSFASPERNDEDAATVNLNVMHNRMHDWGYYLGWTEENANLEKNNVGSENDVASAENDPEIGNSQSGSLAGGATFLGRDNANQITLNDGTPGISNQYLWEPLQAGFYPPCVDGAYDMSIVGHEVGHAIQNRMTDGSNGLNGAQSRSMGESWSDLTAVEYVAGYGFTPVDGESPFAVGAYAIGDKFNGIRNYNMSKSPLNYSDLGYDGNGLTSPHANGEIWSATQFSIRDAMVKKYDRAFPSTNRNLQFACTDGLKPTTQCPGNRRWIQLIHDGFLTQPGATSMLDSRDAILAADKMRYGGANLDLLWREFAKRGMGDTAFSANANDDDAEPGFRSALNKGSGTGSVRFRAVSADGTPLPAKTNVFIGDYEARVTPVATIARGGPSAAVSIEPGTYKLFAQALGAGHRRLTMTVKPGAQVIDVPVRRNLASGANGAVVTGDGGKSGTAAGDLNKGFLVDDSEANNFAILNEGPIQGKQATVELAGGRQLVREVQVSAVNRGALCDGPTGNNPEEVIECPDGDSAPYDTGGQNRFAALRSFEVLACDATTGKDCTDPTQFTSVRTFMDAFPADRPRPTVPDLNLRTFAIPDTRATHLQLKILDNQCTGGPLYTGEANPENNPLSDPDCETGQLTTAALTGAPATTTNLSQVQRVRIAEFQAFSTRTVAAPPVKAPPTVSKPTAPRPVAGGGGNGNNGGGGSLAATGAAPVALPALLLLVMAVGVHRARRRIV